MATAADVRDAFYGSDGQYSLQVQRDLKKAGVVGEVAARMRQAQKLTIKGPSYRDSRIAEKAYWRREKILKELLSKSLPKTDWNWGIVLLPSPSIYQYHRGSRGALHRPCLCIDIPKWGQVGFTAVELEGPPYQGELNTLSLDQQTYRILGFCSSLCAPSGRTLWDHLLDA